jgi:hypothetical protein
MNIFRVFFPGDSDVAGVSEGGVGRVQIIPDAYRLLAAEWQAWLLPFEVHRNLPFFNSVN